MTEQVQVTDIASMLMSDGDNPEPENESTGATEELQELLEVQPEEAEELEADSDGEEEAAIEGDDSDEAR